MKSESRALARWSMMWFKLFAATLFAFSAGKCLANDFDTLKIDATLDTLGKSISGSVSYRLPSEPSIRTIEFQLFPNVYSYEQSPYLRNRVNIMGRMRASGRWGETIIDSVLLDGSNSTDFLNIEYTCGKLEPDDSIRLNGKTIDIYFKTVLPEIGDRLSYSNDDYLLDGWFPRPAILQEDGTWYNPDYGPFSELVGEFYYFDVNLKLPSNLIVAASALPSDKKAIDTLAAYHYIFGPAHDFALSVSPDYLIDTVAIGPKTLHLYYRDYEYSMISQVKHAAEKTFGYMTGRVGDYTYDCFSIATAKMSFGGGVEFPGLIAVASPAGLFMTSRFYKVLVIHEVVHQWFYGMIGSDQIKNPWMDEGVTSLFSLKLTEKIYGQKANFVDWAGVEAEGRDYFRFFNYMTSWSNGINESVNRFALDADYVGTVYFKGALALETFENFISDSVADRFWKSYYSEFLFKRPDTEDFLRVVRRVCGEEAQLLLKDLLDYPEEIDYAVYDLHNKPYDSATYQVSFVLQKKGPLSIPIDYCMVLSNSDTVNYTWEPGINTQIIEHLLPYPAATAIIDPDDKISIDNNLLNNSVSVDADSRPAMRLTSGILFLFESLLSFLGGM